MTDLDVTNSQNHVIALHILMSMGLVLVIMPLMTSALGALPPLLYSHGSAIFSSAQKVAAAGSALFIAVMSNRSTRVLDDGGALPVATAEGIHQAFLFAAVIATAGIVLSLFVRRS